MKAYTERKRRQHLLDFDDLLLFWRALVTTPATGRQVAAMFDHVLVDEYQDTNALQADILEGLRPADGEAPRNVTVVGDDAQAIYGFRAATVRNILEFPERFPGTTVVTLERNYRSSQPILDASNAVIARSPQRHEKALWTDRTDGARPVLQACLDETGQADSGLPRRSSRRANEASRCANRPCCSAPRTTPTCSRSSWPAATSRS